MVTGIIFAIAALIAALLAIAVMKPNRFRVARSLRIHAPPEKIFLLIEDFHKWSVWSPYEHIDPTMQRTFSGAERGVGAVYAWAGTGKAGAGRMEIINADAPSHVAVKLDFSKPFTAHNQAEFTLIREGDFTDVTWAMHGPQLFVGKLMGMVFNMDRLIGKDFEAGLAAIKAAVA